MDQKTAEQKAIAVLRAVVNALAEKRYEDITELAELGDGIQEPLRDFVAEVFRMWGWEQIPPIDHWTEEWVTIPSNPCYEQLNFYHFKDGSGFHVDYDLTSDGELNDFTLQMEFLYDGEGGLRPILLDIHVM